MKGTISDKVYFFSIFILICWGAHAWFTWWFDSATINSYVALLCLNAVALWHKIINGIKLANDTLTVFACSLLFVVSGPLNHYGGIGTYLNFFLRLFPLLIIVSDKQNSERILLFLAKCIAVLLIPGIILYAIFSIVGFPPSLPITRSGSDTYYFFNYFVLLRSFGGMDNTDRFQSVFLEPGYMGTLLAFLLYATKFNLKKWYTKIMIVGLVLSLSLAGIIVGILGYVWLINSKTFRFKRLLLFTLIVSAVYIAGLNYNNGNNILNHAVIERLQFDADKGIVGNNRFSTYADNIYDVMVADGDIWLGVGSLDSLKGNEVWETVSGAGYKIFFISRGVISSILLLLFYFTLCVKSKFNLYKCGFLILVIVTFVQAAYPESFSWLIPFILGIQVDDKEINEIKYI